MSLVFPPSILFNRGCCVTAQLQLQAQGAGNERWRDDGPEMGPKQSADSAKQPTTKKAKQPTTKKKAKPAKRPLDPAVLDDVNTLLTVLHGGDVKEPCEEETPAADASQWLSATQIAEASIRLGINIDIDLAHSMIEFVTGNQDDFEITRSQFVQTLRRLVDGDKHEKK